MSVVSYRVLSCLILCSCGSLSPRRRSRGRRRAGCRGPHPRPEWPLSAARDLGAAGDVVKLFVIVVIIGMIIITTSGGWGPACMLRTFATAKPIPSVRGRRMALEIWLLIWPHSGNLNISCIAQTAPNVSGYAQLRSIFRLRRAIT